MAWRQDSPSIYSHHSWETVRSLPAQKTSKIDISLERMGEHTSLWKYVDVQPFQKGLNGGRLLYNVKRGKNDWRASGNTQQLIEQTDIQDRLPLPFPYLLPNLEGQNCSHTMGPLCSTSGDHCERGFNRC